MIMIYDKNSLLGVLFITKKGVVCQENRPQDMGCFLCIGDVGSKALYSYFANLDNRSEAITSKLF